MKIKTRKKIKFCECGCGKSVSKRFVFNHHLSKTVFLHKSDCRCASCKSKRGELSKENHPRYGTSLLKSTKEKIRNSLLGFIPTKQARMNMSNGQIRSYKKNPERKKQISDSLKISLADPEVRRKMINAHTGLKATQETRKKQSESGLRIWREMPENVKSKRIKKSLITGSPNKKELLLENILQNLYPSEWKFVGNGQVIINGKCPDFINCNGQKKIIELFGDYWHKGQNSQDRINEFKPFGFDTLVIWEKELKNKPLLELKIKKFSEGSYIG